jgi:predicted phage terminase large subunit-like protein
MAELSVKLLKWQQKVYSSKARFKVIAAGRRTGKTRLAAWMLLLYALTPGPGNVFYIAPTQGQARDILWQTLLEIGHPVIANTHINNLQITLINGKTISLKGADRPETMRGVSLKFLVMDEYADMRPSVWEQILRPALADCKGEAMFIGTPMGRNHFYDLYKYAELSGDADYEAWHFTSYDNETLDPAEIDAAKKSMSSYAFRQEFMASFEAMGSEVFKEEWISYGDTPTDGEYFIAIDLAGFEELGKPKSKNAKLDQSSIAVVKVTDAGRWHVKEIIYGRWTFDETITRVFNAVREYKPLASGMEKGILRQAVLSPLTDLMRRQGFFFNLQELTHGNRRKTDRIIASLQGRFENGFVTLEKGEWNMQFLDQLFQFPNPLVHDDLIDSLAYIDQLALIPYGLTDFEDTKYTPLDSMTGY